MSNSKAYVLIQVQTGKAEAVANTLRKIPGVSDADLVAGTCDVIAVLHGSDADSIARLVVNEIHSVKGIQNTVTSMVINQ